MLFAALAASLLPAYAVAQTVHSITVAPSGALGFDPNNVNGVSDGDIVQFVFDAAGHTVTQSTLTAPCTPFDGGFNSGTSKAKGEVWNLTITDTSRPIWFFCATNSPIVHCTQGMVGAVNSPDDAFVSFSDNAKAATNTPTATAVALSGSGAAATLSLTDAPAASASSESGTSTSAAPAESSSSAAQPLSGFEGLGATVLALFGALLF